MGRDEVTLLVHAKPLWQTQLEVLRKLDTDRHLYFCAYRFLRHADEQFVGRSSITRTAERSGCITDANARSAFGGTRLICRKWATNTLSFFAPRWSPLVLCCQRCWSRGTAGGNLPARGCD
jgi:hypothetical protein